jgi:hypothetical protein
VTTATLKALAILAEHGPMLPGGFADRMWPEMRRRRAGGNSQHQGGDNGAICAGGYLGKLCKRGLARREGWDYEITAEGREVLRAVSHTVGARRARLPLKTYNKLLKVARSKS